MKNGFNFVDHIVKELKNNKPSIENNFNVGGTFVSKTSGIISGVEVFIQILEKINRDNKIYHIKDSKDLVNRGDSLVSIRGNASDIMNIKTLGENLLSSICSVSTTMFKYLQEIKDLECDVFVFENNILGIGEYYDAAVEDAGGHVLKVSNAYLPYLVWSQDNVEAILNNISSEEIFIEVTNLDQFKQAISLPCTHIVCVDFDLESIEIASINNTNKVIGIKNNLTFANIHSYANHNIDFVIIDNFYRNLKKFEVEFKFFDI